MWKLKGLCSNPSQLNLPIHSTKNIIRKTILNPLIVGLVSETLPT